MMTASLVADFVADAPDTEAVPAVRDATLDAPVTPAFVCVARVLPDLVVVPLVAEPVTVAIAVAVPELMIVAPLDVKRAVDGTLEHVIHACTVN
jgi:hypothetical protein